MEHFDDQMKNLFSRIITVCTWIGLGVIVIFGGLYIIGFRPLVEMELVAQNWDKPVSQFWISVRGEEARGYGWFILQPAGMDSFVVTGVLLLICTPFIALASVVWRTKGLYLIFVLILIVEYLFSLLRPLL
jgi:hypothetical protein